MQLQILDACHIPIQARVLKNDAEAFARRGAAEYQLGNNLAAVVDQTKSLMIEPKDAFALRNRGLAELALRNYAAAVTDERYAIAYGESAASNALAYDAMGDALVLLGRRTEAIDAYQHVLAIDPGNDDARRKIERLQALPGHVSHGVRFAGWVAQLDPSGVQGWTSHYDDTSKGAAPRPAQNDGSRVNLVQATVPAPPRPAPQIVAHQSVQTAREERNARPHQLSPRDPTPAGRPALGAPRPTGVRL